MPVRIALVEDNHTLRHRLIERFRFFEEVTLQFAAATGEECLQRLRALAPDARPQVVLMDIELPGQSGVETTAALKDAHPDIDVLMLTVFEHEERIFASIRAGASGYLLKETSAQQVVAAVLELVRGGAPMSPAVARKMLGFVRSQPAEKASNAQGEAPGDAFALSPRETEILAHLVEDDTEAEIADRLHISPHTVRTHIKNIYKKMHVHSRASAVRVALQNRLIG